MFELRVDPDELNVSTCVTRGQVFRWRKSDDGTWIGVDGPSWFCVKQDGPLAPIRVKSNASLEAFRRLFRLEVSVKAIYAEIIQLGPELKPFLGQTPGLRLMRPTSAIETLFCFLCTPNNHLARIESMTWSLGAYGDPVPELVGRNYFPSLDRIAEIDEAELREKGFGYRASTIPKVARQLNQLGGEAWLNKLKDKPYGEVFEVLLGINGIGPKLADCISLFGLGHMEAVPVDTHLWQAYVRIYEPTWEGKSLTLSRYRVIGKRLRDQFGLLAGWVHHQLYAENQLNWRSRLSR